MTYRKLGAEFVGTFLLVFLAVGAAVFGIGGGVGADGAGPASGTVGVALAFGLVVLMLAYAFGPVSGTHVNPAVTLGMVLAKRMPAREGAGYAAAQFAGAILGAATLKLFVSAFGVTDRTGALGTNSYDNGAVNLPGAFVLEALLTAAFVLVILLVTERVATPALAGSGNRPVAHRGSPRGDPADRHVGEPRTLVRPGALRGRHRADAGVVVHPRPARRVRPGGRGLEAHPGARRRRGGRRAAWRHGDLGVPRGLDRLTPEGPAMHQLSAVRRVAVVAAALCAAGLGATSAAASPATSATSSPEEQLAQRFAPVVVSRVAATGCGDGEHYAPISVDAVLGRPDVTLRLADGTTKSAPVAADLAGLGEGTYLDLPGDPLKPHCDYSRWVGSLAAEPTVYARVATDPAAPGELALQYWLYYAYNDWNDRHEGDWEMVQLNFDAATATEALAAEPVTTIFAQHEGGEVADWNDPKVHRDGDHVAVYPGQGSHASYYGQSVWFGKSSQSGFGCDDTSVGRGMTAQAHLPRRRHAHRPALVELHRPLGRAGSVVQQRTDRAEHQDAVGDPHPVGPRRGTPVGRRAARGARRLGEGLLQPHHRRVDGLPQGAGLPRPRRHRRRAPARAAGLVRRGDAVALGRPDARCGSPAGWARPSSPQRESCAGIRASSFRWSVPSW